jgi:hypothetical protein
MPNRSAAGNDQNVRDHFESSSQARYGRTVVVDFEARLQSILAALDECRLGLLDCASPEAAHLLALAALEIRMKLNRVSDSELKALCDAIGGDQSQAEIAQEKALHRPRWRPALKLVK